VSSTNTNRTRKASSKGAEPYLRDQTERIRRAGWLNAAWLLLLSIWIAGLFVLGTLLSAHVVSLPIKALIVFAGSAAGILTSGYLFLNAPQIRTNRIQASQLHAFCKAIKQAAGTLQLQEILDSAARVIVEVTEVRGCSIKLLESRTGKLRARTIVGIEPDAIESTVKTVDSIYHAGMMAKGSVIVRDTLLREFPAVNEEAESLVCVPLHLEERMLGAICVFGKPGQPLSSQMISLLASLGNVVSLAIAHAFVYEDLERLVQVKTRFMFQASHELRSPLNAIQSIARTLMEGHLGELSEKQRELLARIDTRAAMLSEIVGDLLILATSRAELATLKPVPVDLVRLLDECVRFFETKAAERGIELSCQSQLPEALVFGSLEGLRSVITNLLSNAIKYTPGGGRVTLRLFEAKDQFVFEVSDTGIGIPVEEQERLFTEFFRASNANTIAQTGTGLGLSIVKATVEQHGGTLEVESEVGRGSCFRILLNKYAPP
jgi:signal transduction histidine kinase